MPPDRLPPDPLSGKKRKVKYSLNVSFYDTKTERRTRLHLVIRSLFRSVGLKVQKKNYFTDIFSDSLNQEQNPFLPTIGGVSDINVLDFWCI